MRSRFIPQMSFGCVPIEEIEFDVFCRHESIPILMALQYIYVNRQDSLFKICELIEKDILDKQSKKLGCKGLTYWEIFILASIRLGCNLDYDHLSDLASNHRNVRQMLGLSYVDEKRYPKSTINDNLISLSKETLDAISDIIVDEGHRLSPGNAVEKVRGDSYVLKKNIHYPTDTNLLVDGIRKVIQLSTAIAALCDISIWRQHSYLCNKARNIKRDIERVSRSRKKDKEDEKKIYYQKLLDFCEVMIERSLETIFQFNTLKDKLSPFNQQRGDQLVSELQYFIAGAEYVSELAVRRVINGEEIPNSDKVFSLFEPDTELINRGKKPNPIEFGHRVMIVQDSAGFIVHAQVMDIGITDEKILIEVMANLQKRFNGKIHAASFDKGFWTPDNLRDLSKIVALPVLPKKGKRSARDAERETAKEFGKARKWHSGVESAIHALGVGNGLIVCRDKGVDGYQRYLAFGFIGRNLQTLGTILLEKEQKLRREEKLMAIL